MNDEALDEDNTALAATFDDPDQTYRIDADRARSGAHLVYELVRAEVDYGADGSHRAGGGYEWPRPVRLGSWTPRRVIEMVEPGDSGPWSGELAWLWSEDLVNMTQLMQSVLAEGIRKSIEITLQVPQGTFRMRDGHHRVGVALALDLPEIPVDLYLEEEMSAESLKLMAPWLSKGNVADSGGE